MSYNKEILSEGIDEFKKLFNAVIEDSKEDFITIANRCKERVYAEQGIPVFLALEDLTKEEIEIESGDKIYNFLIVIAISIFMEHYKEYEGKEEIESKDIGKIVELVAAKYFNINSLEH